jgi:hypothetical protein
MDWYSESAFANYGHVAIRVEWDAETDLKLIPHCSTASGWWRHLLQIASTASAQIHGTRLLPSLLASSQ